MTTQPNPMVEEFEEEQTTEWPKEKVQNDKKRSTKHTLKTKDRVTRTPLKHDYKHMASFCVAFNETSHSAHGVCYLNTI